MSVGGQLRQLIKQVLPPALELRLRLARARFLLSVDPELELLPLLARGGAFIDVGANIGVWSRWAAKSFAKVYAFEPDSALSKSLAKIMPLNVEVYPIALSDHKGQSELATPIIDGVRVSGRASLEKSVNSDLERSGQTVELRTLDSFGFKGIDVIKIDVEGHEAAVLAGASTLLAAEKPVLICEIEEYRHPDSSEAIIADICRRDYACYFIRRNNLVLFEPGQVRELQKAIPTHLDTKYEDYVNNFIFIPAGRPDLEPAIRALLQKRR